MTWCHVPETGLASAAEPVALIWALCSQSPGFIPVAMSNGKNTPAKASSQASGPDISPLPQSGMTSPPSTPDHLPVQSTLSSPDTPASRSARQDNAKAKTTNGTSGRISNGSPSNSEIISHGVSSRTSGDMSRLASKPCCEPFDKWASRLALAYSQRKKSVRRTKGSAFSSWPTAKAMTGGANSQREARGAGGPDLQGAAQNWPTPTAKSEAQTAQNPTPGQTGGTTLAGAAEQMWMTPAAVMTREGWTEEEFKTRQAEVKARTNAEGKHHTGNGFGPSLAAQATMWGTPRASDAEKGSPNQSFGAGGTPLPAQTANWPTPASRDHKGSSETALTRKDGKSRLDLLDLLDFAAEQAFSHPAQATWSHGRPSFETRRIIHRLLADRGLFKLPKRLRHAYSPPTRRPSKNPAREKWRRAHQRQKWEERRRKFWSSARLNPTFVNLLMGWPKGHALCACSETEWSHWKRHMRGALSALPTAYGPWIWEPPTITQQPEPTQGSLFDAL